MGENNQQGRIVPEQRNFKLYKAKKQWMTACATFLLTFGATAVMNVSANADSNSDGNNTPKAAELVQTANTSQEQTNSMQSVAANPATEQEQTASTPVTKQEQATGGHPATVPTAASATPAGQANDNGQAASAAASPQTATKNVAENIAPDPYKITDSATPYVIAGTNLTDMASKFFKNADELTKAGATFSWVGTVPNPTQQEADAGTTISGTIKVTYADGTSVDVPIESFVEPQSQLQPNTFYYVNKVGDTPDFNIADANGNSFATILYNQNAFNPDAFSYKVLGTIDTSSIGIHWVNVQVTDNNTFNGIPGAPQVIGGPYVVQVPYVVQGLKLLDNLPTDANGNLVINAQLATTPQSTSTTPTTPQVAFDPTGFNNGGIGGQYFYQDYALAYALGIKITASNWTTPTDLVNTKTNHFTMSFSNLPNAKAQEVDVNYVSSPQAEDMYIFNAPNRTYFNGRGENTKTITGSLADGYMNDKVWVTLADGTKVYASQLNFVDNAAKFPIGGPRTGKYNINFDASFSQTNSAGQPLIFSNNIFNNASAKFNSDLNEWYQKTNNTATANYGTHTAATWDKVSTVGTALAPSIKASDDPYTQDLTDGPYTFDSDALGKLVKNPATPQEVQKVQPNWANNIQPNSILDNNTKWPAGTTFTWQGNDGSTTLSLDKAGESKTGDVTITLPSGSSCTVKNITVISRANVTAKSETVDYGTTLKPEELVTNKDVFPTGTTFQFVNGSEPTWSKADVYPVQITATYTDESGAKITTPVATCSVAINDSRSITVLAGSDVPSADSILNLPADWATHTVSWTKDINTGSTNEGLITIHYPGSNLGQTIKVYVTVIPKTSAVDGQNFFTNGKKYDGTAGSIANGANQGAILTRADGQAIDYTTYTGEKVPGQSTDYTQGPTSYAPEYSLSGLKTNSDGSLVSGVQTVLVRVSVPKGTLGAQVDADGNYYYELPVSVNVAQRVTFELVDDDNNGAVIGTPQTQEFIKGQATTINPALVIPAGYELAAGQTLPTTYTLADYGSTVLIVKVHLKHQPAEIINSNSGSQNTTTGTVTGGAANSLAYQQTTGAANESAGKQAAELPQTGSSTDEAALGAGLLLTSLAGLFGLAGLTKRKEERN